MEIVQERIMKAMGKSQMSVLKERSVIVSRIWDRKYLSNRMTVPTMVTQA